MYNQSMDATVPAWLAVVGTLSGYAAAFATEYLRGRQELTREREARREAKQAAIYEARDLFERETLIEFQDAAAVLMRNVARVMHETEREYQRTGTWGRSQLPDNVGGEPSAQLARDVARLRVRLLDDRLRTLAGDWSLAAAEATLPSLRDELDVDARSRNAVAFRTCGDLYRQLSEAIGERIRLLVTRWPEK